MATKDDKKKKGWSTGAKVAGGAAIGSLATAGGIGYLAKRAVDKANQRRAAKLFANHKAVMRKVTKAGAMSSVRSALPKRVKSSINARNFLESRATLDQLAAESDRIVNLAKCGGAMPMKGAMPGKKGKMMKGKKRMFSAKGEHVELASMTEKLSAYSDRLVNLAKKQDDNDDDDSTLKKVGKGAAIAGGVGAAGTTAAYLRGRAVNPGQGFLPTLQSGAGALVGDAKTAGAGLSDAAYKAWLAAKKKIGTAAKTVA